MLFIRSCFGCAIFVYYLFGIFGLPIGDFSLKFGLYSNSDQRLRPVSQTQSKESGAQREMADMLDDADDASHASRLPCNVNNIYVINVINASIVNLGEASFNGTSDGRNSSGRPTGDHTCTSKMKPTATGCPVTTTTTTMYPTMTVYPKTTMTRCPTTRRCPTTTTTTRPTTTTTFDTLLPPVTNECFDHSTASRRTTTPTPRTFRTPSTACEDNAVRTPIPTKVTCHCPAKTFSDETDA